MPLVRGRSDDAISKNIERLMREYHATGKIGNTTPKNAAHALSIAQGIAYDTAGRSRRKAIEKHMRRGGHGG